MPVTLAEAALNTQDEVDRLVIDEFRKQSALLDSLLFHDTVNPMGGGSTLTYGYHRVMRSGPPRSARSTPSTSRRRPRRTATRSISSRSAARSTATVSLNEVDGRPTVVSSNVRVIAQVMGVDDDTFRAIVDEAAALCPISRLFTGAATTVDAVLDET